MTTPTINNHIKKLQSELTHLEKAWSNIDSFIHSPNPGSNTSHLADLAANLSGLTSNTEKTITAIKNSFSKYPKQLSDKEKYALWKLLLKYFQLANRSLKALDDITDPVERLNFGITSDIGKSQNNLCFIHMAIKAMQFDTAHLYRRSNLPADISNQIPEDFNFANSAVKPSVIEKLIAKACVRALTKVAEKELNVANTIKNTLLSAPDDVHNSQLQIDSSTVCQAIKYINPAPTDKWLIVVGGAGASYANMLFTAKELADQEGYNFLVVDYLAKKDTLTDAVKIIVTAAKHLMSENSVSPEHLSLIGHSNGGRIVTQAAAYLPGCNVITNNTYTSLEEVIIGHVINAADTLRNMGLPVNKHVATIISAATRSFEQHGLDKKAINILHDALEKTGNSYQSGQAKAKIPAHKFAAVYTAPNTEYTENGDSKVKLFKAKDNVLFNAVDGKIQAKEAKLNNPGLHEELQKKTIPLDDQMYVKAIKYKDRYNPEDTNHHLVLKGVSPADITNPHNIINTKLLGQAVKELEKQQDKIPLSLQKQFENLLENHGLTRETEQLLPTCSSIELDQRERFVIMKVMSHLNSDSAATWPTQEQLMRIFQASDFAADMISRYSGALNKLFQGEGGKNFLHARLATLDKRIETPNPHLNGYGSYLNKNLADTILKRLRAYYDATNVNSDNDEYLKKLRTHHNNTYGLFSHRSPAFQKAIRLKRQPVTVSDLDLTQIFTAVPACS